jgi:hypothetical protein
MASYNYQFIDDRGSGYFELSQLASGGVYSLDYLVEVARGGQLKSFKIGDKWFTSEQWLADFIQRVRQDLSQLSSEPETKWAKHLGPKPIRHWHFTLINFLIVLLFFSWLAIVALVVALIQFGRA